MSSIIEIQNLSKQYKIAEVQQYLSLRDEITGFAKKVFGSSDKTKTEFLALDNINLDIEAGDRIGIIGRNGAGKSTLLKILSKITPPTKGSIKLKGKVASLLEVGTGFHNELTGRENIFLNGAILGLRKKEIQQKLDEIISFSGVEKFIDTPLKHYSSGMQLRLAFSVAAHLEPEILLIDEVLAVGDMEFQKKCLGKMEEVSRSDGRTILFVSHNLAQLKQICQSAILLDKGKLISKGSITEVISNYTSLFHKNNSAYYAAEKEKDQLITKVVMKTEKGVINTSINSTDNLSLEISIITKKEISNSLLAIRITNQENIPVFTTTNGDEQLNYPSFAIGEYHFSLPLPANELAPGKYFLRIAWIIPNYEVLDEVAEELQFEIENDQYPGHILKDGRLGVINKIIPWKKIN
jgi:lipopolysaccharide transport system ATP-binding protein